MIKETNRKIPLVSIITVCLNSEKYIEQAIRSVTCQTYDNIEYIVIDGGSTDKTLDIIRKYEDKITYWISERDEGISDAFNKGIKAARGDLIGILNSDDWYEKNTAEEVAKAYILDKDIGVIHGDICFYKSSKPLFIVSPHSNPERLWREMIYNHPACFVARKCYKDFGMFDKSLTVAMDYELLLRFYVNNIKFLYVPRVLANQRCEGKSEKQVMKSLVEVYRSVIKYGYPRYKALFWLILSVFKKSIRNMLGVDNIFLQTARRLSKRKRLLKNL